jgi:hypothetical protein
MALYLVPSESVPGEGVTYYGPKYFAWRFGTGTLPKRGQVDYGFIDGYLVEADLDAAQIAALTANPDVYAFPANLDAAISPNDGLRTMFEGFNIPTDWLTSATTYRELIRKLYGIIKFAQRFAYIAGENGAPPGTFLFGVITLDTRYRNFPADVANWFSLTVASYGIDPGIIRANSTVRQMLKQASDIIESEMIIGGVTY